MGRRVRPPAKRASRIRPQEVPEGLGEALRDSFFCDHQYPAVLLTCGCHIQVGSIRAAMLPLLLQLHSSCVAAAPSIPGVGIGRYNATFFTHFLPIATVEAMLPAAASGVGKLELAAQTLSPAGTHPIVFVFGHQVDVRPRPPLPQAFDWIYEEFILSIPHTQLDEKWAKEHPNGASH